MKLQNLFEDDVDDLRSKLKQAEERLKDERVRDAGPGGGQSSRQRVIRAEREVQQLRSKLKRAEDPRSDDEIASDEQKTANKNTLAGLKRARERAKEKIKTLPAYGADKVKRALPAIDAAIKELESGKNANEVDFSQFNDALRLVRDY